MSMISCLNNDSLDTVKKARQYIAQGRGRFYFKRETRSSSTGEFACIFFLGEQNKKRRRPPISVSEWLLLS